MNVVKRLLAVVALVATMGCFIAPGASANLVRLPGLCSVADAPKVPGDPIIRIATFAAQGTAAIAHADGGKTAGAYGGPLCEGVEAGKVERYVGDASLAFRFHGIHPNFWPATMTYYSRAGLCEGTAAVQKIASNAVEVRVPLRGGPCLGQVVLDVPRTAFFGKESGTVIPDVLACVESSFPMMAPVLTAGPEKGKSNTLCGLPAGDGGFTYLARQVRDGGVRVYYPLIALPAAAVRRP